MMDGFGNVPCATRDVECIPVLCMNNGAVNLQIKSRHTAVLNGNKVLGTDVVQCSNQENGGKNDFFHWIGSDRNFRGLNKIFRLIAQEISSYDFNNVDEDILKGVYQELIDLDTRHALGEYYTPDWLCERVVNEFEFNIFPL